jgi:hypothetical protein
MPPEKRPLPEITWEKIAPPYLDYDYFQGIDLYPFRPQATDFDMVNAWWLIEAATLAYAEKDFAKPIFRDAGFTEIKFFSGNSTQCFVVNTDDFLILVFRGTEVRPRPDSPYFLNIIEDILADIRIPLVPVDDSGQGGMVHQGFKEALDEVWEKQGLADYIRERDNGKRTLWITGHSLGAALATLAAQRYGNGVRLYTYGSPRVGDMAFKKTFPLKNYRFVNNSDIVTRIPYTWMGYQHLGECEYIDSQGSIHKNSDSCEEEKPDIQAKIATFIKSVEKGSTIINAPIPEELLDHVPILYSIHIWNNIP